jgi:membrane peptidoglycan carboxypeptidase
MARRSGNTRRRWSHRLPPRLRRLLRALLVLAIIGAVALLVLLLVYGRLAGRFDLAEVASIPARTTIVDRDGTEIDAGRGMRSRLATRDQLPDFLVDALRAREDMRFFDHGGVDLRGLARATVRNIRDRSFTQGASTLTMQLARNTFDMRAKSLHRKMLEIALTVRIESRYDKDEILVHYLNRIYFGAGCHGIEEAAQTYFTKSTAALTPGESAMLVGIIRGPHMFSPFRNLDGAIEQRDQVLTRMVAAGFIDQSRADEIRSQPIQLVPEEQRQPERSYALQNVRTELDSIVSQGNIRDGGLRVGTTLSAGWQLRLETEIAKAVNAWELSPGWPHPTHRNHQPGVPPAYLQVAAVTIETKTGAILALIGGRDYLDSRFDRSSGARRDLGSAVEPFVAAAAAERGRLVLPGQPVQTGRQIGPTEVARIFRRCGITGPFNESEDLFRGSAATTPIELATALATLGNKGRRPKPHLVTSIADRSGATLYRVSPELSPAITASAAADALDLFESDTTTGVFHGFTGSCRDGWILRLGPTGSTAIWFGFDTPAKICSPPKLEKFLANFSTRLANL